jgi:hypothetical protein
MSRSSVRVAFFKGKGGIVHSIVRWWTSSIYSHAELILPDQKTWVTISPFFNSRVSLRVRSIDPNDSDWDFVELPLSWRGSVREYQLSQLNTFVQRTRGLRYDWVGMMLSQISPFLVKRRDAWYCSEWIAHALVKSRILSWDYARIYDTPNMSPGKLHGLLSGHIPSYK